MKKERLAKYETRVKVYAGAERTGDDVPEFRLRPNGDGVRGGSWRLTRIREGRCTTQHLTVRRHPVDGSLECSCLAWLRWNRCVHAEFVALLVSGHASLEPKPENQTAPEVRGSDECLRV